jgi:hypothetical protein
MHDHLFLKNLVETVNAESFAVTKERATCVLTADALNGVLQELGWRSYLLRVETTVGHQRDRTFAGCALGRGPWERRGAAPGMWRGHLVVAVDTAWLLDPTIDQANRPEWGRERVGPLVVRLPGTFWVDPKGHRVVVGSLEIIYRLHPRPQSGFASKVDARPSHWRPIAERVLSQISGRAGKTSTPVIPKSLSGKTTYDCIIFGA